MYGDPALAGKGGSPGGMTGQDKQEQQQKQQGIMLILGPQYHFRVLTISRTQSKRRIGPFWTTETEST